MTKAKKVLFITQEITPYVPESQMSVIGRTLPQAIQDSGREIRTFMPRWGIINERRNQLHEVIRLSGMNIIIDDTDHPLIIKVASIQAARMQVYFIDNDDYFHKRRMMCDEEGKEYADNAERAIFYARGVLETVKKLRWVPDIIHCHGWMSAIAPLFIKTAYHDDPPFANAKVVFSAYDEMPQAPLGTNFSDCLQFRDCNSELLASTGIDLTSGRSLGELALAFSDGFVQLSPEKQAGLTAFAQARNIRTLHPDELTPVKEQYGDFYDQVYADGE